MVVAAAVVVAAVVAFVYSVDRQGPPQIAKISPGQRVLQSDAAAMVGDLVGLPHQHSRPLWIPAAEKPSESQRDTHMVMVLLSEVYTWVLRYRVLESTVQPTAFQPLGTDVAVGAGSLQGQRHHLRLFK